VPLFITDSQYNRARTPRVNNTPVILYAGQVIQRRSTIADFIIVDIRQKEWAITIEEAEEILAIGTCRQKTSPEPGTTQIV
jgi:hypothetical protein